MILMCKPIGLYLSSLNNCFASVFRDSASDSRQRSSLERYFIYLSGFMFSGDTFLKFVPLPIALNLLTHLFLGL